MVSVNLLLINESLQQNVAVLVKVYCGPSYRIHACSFAVFSEHESAKLTKEFESNNNTGNVMQFRRLLGKFAKTYLAIGALLISASAVADCYRFNEINYDNSCPSTCNPASCCSGSCCGFPVNPAPECGWAYNPPAYPRCGCEINNCCGNFLDTFTFRSDFLWWRACEDGLELGSEESFVDIVGTNQTLVSNTSRTKRPNFKYDPGFRIGLATACACECWDFAVNWIHFHTKAKAHGASNFTDGNNITFVSDWERVEFFYPSTSEGKFKLNFDLVDIEFGRKYYASSCFVLRPQFGLRIARINQTFRVISRASNQLVGAISNFESSVRARSDFLAVGPRCGIDIELHLCGGFGLFGQAAGSIVFGKFNRHGREQLNFLAIGEDFFNYETKNSGHCCSRAITDLAFGIKWSRCFDWCNRSHPVTIAFAWEHHAFFNFNNFNFASDGVEVFGASESDIFELNGNIPVSKRGDLFTQGLTISAAFGF
jgi:hypothetical protein